MVGSYEPDTLRDAADGWMFTEPDVAAGGPDKVYFNGWYGVYPLQPANPNLASLGTARSHTHFRLWAAMGAWKDCNQDGYVGLGDQGLFEYRAELLLGDTSVCPPAPGGVPATRPWGYAPPHNDGQWVHELIPIAWNRADAERVGDVDDLNYNDNASRIWADFGLPEGTGSGAGCVINPQPRGTYHSAGGALEFVDCHARWRITDGWNSLVAGTNGDDLGIGQLSFSDRPRDQSGSASLLNVRNPWGDQEDASFVEPWDCSQEQVAVRVDNVIVEGVDGVVADQTTPAVNVTNASMPRAPPGVSATGSPGGTTNATMSGFDRCERRDDVAGGGTGGAYASLPYAQEADLPTSSAKTGSSDYFSPHEVTRPAAPWQVVIGRGGPSNGGVAHLDDLGLVDAAAEGGLAQSGFWMGDRTNYVATPFVDTGRYEASRVYHVTYYALVSPSAINAYGLALPKGSTLGTYGQERCGATIGPGAPVENGWSCDPTRWYKEGDADIMPRSTYLGPGPDGLGVPYGVKVGDKYNLRDIDCYDESAGPARDADVHWGVVTGTACANTPWQAP